MSRSYLEQALSLAQSVAIHCPKVEVRFSTGDNQVGVHRMKHSSQYRVVGALQRVTMKHKSLSQSDWVL